MRRDPSDPDGQYDSHHEIEYCASEIPVYDYMTNDAGKSEPAPIHNSSRPITLMVIEDLLSRDRLGWERYGMPLQAGNGRDALMDAYQEALDLCQYLRQAIEERGNDR